MMKLAFSTLGCPLWDFEKVITQAGQLGFQAVEIRGIRDEMRVEHLACFQPENQEKTRRLLKMNGISICGIGTSCMFHDGTKYLQALEEGKRAINLCASMHIPFIRVFGNEFPKGENKESVIRRVAGGIGELCAYAEKNSSVQVLLEVHGDFNTIETLTAVAEYLCEYKSFGMIWDVEHSYTVYENDFESFYRTIKQYVRHVHLKDCRMENGAYVCCIPGSGSIPLKKIVRMLLDDGYDGCFSFEWEKRWHSELEEPEIAFPCYVEFMRSVL